MDSRFWPQASVQIKHLCWSNKDLFSWVRVTLKWSFSLPSPHPFCQYPTNVLIPLIRCLLLCGKSPQMYQLKTTHICYLTVSMWQDSGHSLTEFSAQGLIRPLLRCPNVVSLGLWSYLRLPGSWQKFNPLWLYMEAPRWFIRYLFASSRSNWRKSSLFLQGSTSHLFKGMFA